MTERQPTAHERLAGQPWDASYQGGPAPWDVGHAQAAIARLADAGAFRGSVLDAGCGTGENALYIAAQGCDVLGVDVAETAVEMARAKARERGVAAQFELADALQLETVARTFDAVVDVGLFHSLDEDERRRYVAGLAAVTRPGAVVYVLCFSDEGEDPGPHPVSKDDLASAFARWEIVSIEPERVETRFHENDAPAWLATLRR
jgi:cyclopropane fatty-acyl-phospholipid synthase-like methyltransferase